MTRVIYVVTVYSRASGRLYDEEHFRSEKAAKAYGERACPDTFKVTMTRYERASFRRPRQSNSEGNHG